MKKIYSEQCVDDLDFWGEGLDLWQAVEALEKALAANGYEVIDRENLDQTVFGFAFWQTVRPPHITAELNRLIGGLYMVAAGLQRIEV